MGWNVKRVLNFEVNFTPPWERETWGKLIRSDLNLRMPPPLPPLHRNQWKVIPPLVRIKGHHQTWVILWRVKYTISYKNTFRAYNFLFWWLSILLRRQRIVIKSVKRSRRPLTGSSASQSPHTHTWWTRGAHSTIIGNHSTVRSWFLRVSVRPLQFEVWPLREAAKKFPPLLVRPIRPFVD